MCEIFSSGNFDDCLNVLKVGNEFYRFVHDRIHLSLEASMFLAENLFLQYLTE